MPVYRFRPTCVARIIEYVPEGRNLPNKSQDCGESSLVLRGVRKNIRIHLANAYDHPSTMIGLQLTGLKVVQWFKMGTRLKLVKRQRMSGSSLVICLTEAEQSADTINRERYGYRSYTIELELQHDNVS